MEGRFGYNEGAFGLNPDVDEEVLEATETDGMEDLKRELALTIEEVERLRQEIARLDELIIFAQDKLKRGISTSVDKFSLNSNIKRYKAEKVGLLKKKIEVAQRGTELAKTLSQAIAQDELEKRAA